MDTLARIILLLLAIVALWIGGFGVEHFHSKGLPIFSLLSVVTGSIFAAALGVAAMFGGSTADETKTDIHSLNSITNQVVDLLLRCGYDSVDEINLCLDEIKNKNRQGYIDNLKIDS